MSVENAPESNASIPIPVPVNEPPKTKPSKLETIGVLMLINGILNVIYNIGTTIFVFITFLSGALATFGLGCLCFPVIVLPVLPLVFGIFEIVYGSRLMSSNSVPVRYQTVQTIAILEIVCVIAGNFISLAIGIINLVFIGESEVKKYYGIQG
jgi:hypothetical protein